MSVNRKRTSNVEETSSPAKKPRIALYLEDYTPIRTIEVSNLPIDVNKDYLLGYFEREGPVQNVEIVRKTMNDKDDSLAYVTFVLPEDAAKWISEGIGHCRNSNLILREADSAYQPKIDPNALNLEKINDHCLLCIISHLSLMDAISLCKTSKRFRQLSQLFYGKYSNFSFGAINGDLSINETNLPTMLEELGGYITSIEWHNLNAAQLDILAQFCPNVIKMKLYSPSKDLSTIALNRNKKFFGSLKRLHIVSGAVFDGNVKVMLSGKKVKTVDLDRCRFVSGKFLNSINSAKLKNIRIVNCTRVTDISAAGWKNKLVTFAYDKCCSYIPCLTSPPESLGKLKELELDFSCFQGSLENLQFDALKSIQKFTITRKNRDIVLNFNNIINAVSKIDSLESLNIEGIKIDIVTIDYLGAIKNLKNLRMSRAQNGIGRNLYEILRVKLPNIHELSIHFVGAEDVTGKLISNMIEAMAKLKYFSHSSITWQLLDIILQGQLSKPNTKLNIGVSKNIFDDPVKKTFDAKSKGAVLLSLHN